MKAKLTITCVFIALFPLLISAQDENPIRPQQTNFHLNFLPLGLGLETPIGKNSTFQMRGNMTIDLETRTINDNNETYWRLGSQIDLSYRRYYKGIFQNLQEKKAYQGQFFDYLGVMTRVFPPYFIDEFPNQGDPSLRFSVVGGGSYYFKNNRLFFDFFVGPAFRLDRRELSFTWPVFGATFGMLLNQ